MVDGVVMAASTSIFAIAKSIMKSTKVDGNALWAVTTTFVCNVFNYQWLLSQ